MNTMNSLPTRDNEIFSKLLGRNLIGIIIQVVYKCFQNGGFNSIYSKTKKKKGSNLVLKVNTIILIAMILNIA